MKRIGFIDYFLDEWHAEKYPEWIAEASAGRMKVAYAYGLIDSPNGMTNVAWCGKKGIELLGSIEEIVERSDYLIVLSPDHPEQHEQLCQLPLRSGKPTYVDKTFAPDRNTALKLFELAELYGTPIYSSSALRFAEEYTALDRHGIETISSTGPGKFENYAIHQVEPVVSLMGTDVKRVMWIGSQNSPALLIEFDGGRQAEIRHFGWECPFGMSINDLGNHVRLIKVESDFFASFIQSLMRFFDSGIPEIEPAETITIMTILELGMKASERPYHWFEYRPAT